MMSTILKFITVMVLGTFFCTSFASEKNVDEIISQCLPDRAQPAQESELTIEVMRKKDGSILQKYQRWVLDNQLHLMPEKNNDPGYIRTANTESSSIVRRIYDKGKKSSVRKIESYPESSHHWLLSEDFALLSTRSDYQFNISSKNSFGGISYINLVARSKSADAPFPKIMLALKESPEDGCALIRSTLFSDETLPRKKIFYKWKYVDGNRVLKSLHIDDAKTLDNIKYHIENIRIVKSFEPDVFVFEWKTNN